MPEPDLASFDPYARWLGIPPAEQPPDHYRLLGLARFETDPARIAAAADARMALLRSVQTGPRGLIAQKIINEVAAARVCLLSPERKSLYDKELWERLAAHAQSAPTGQVHTPGAAVVAAPTFFSAAQIVQPFSSTSPLTTAPLATTPTSAISTSASFEINPLMPTSGGPLPATAPKPATEIPVSAVASVVRYRRRRQGGLWIWVIATGLAVAGLATLAYVLSQKLP